MFVFFARKGEKRREGREERGGKEGERERERERERVPKGITSQQNTNCIPGMDLLIQSDVLSD